MEIDAKRNTSWLSQNIYTEKTNVTNLHWHLIRNNRHEQQFI